MFAAEKHAGERRGGGVLSGALSGLDRLHLHNVRDEIRKWDFFPAISKLDRVPLHLFLLVTPFGRLSNYTNEVPDALRTVPVTRGHAYLHAPGARPGLSGDMGMVVIWAVHRGAQVSPPKCLAPLVFEPLCLSLGPGLRPFLGRSLLALSLHEANQCTDGEQLRLGAQNT